MAEADLATATSVVEAHKAIPTFDPPGAPFDAKTCMAGKKILSIPVTSAIPFVAGIEEALGIAVRLSDMGLAALCQS